MNKNTKLFDNLIQILMPVFIFLMVNLFYLKTYDSCQIKITLLHIGGAIIITLWFLKRIASGEYLKFNKKEMYFIIPVVLYLISGIISYSLTPFKSTSIFDLIKRIIYIGLFFVAFTEFREEKRYKRLFYSILIAGSITTIYGIVQIIDFKYFPNGKFPRGIDPFLWRQAFGSRIFSTFGNPNFYAAFLVLISPMVISCFLLSKKKYYLLYLLGIIFCIYYSYSKGSWIGLPAGTIMIAFLTILYLAHANKQKITRIITISTIILVLSSSFGVFYLIKQRIDSVRFRVFTWQATWEMIRRPVYVSSLQSQILGTGLGTFLIVYPAYRMSQIFYIEGKHNTETDHPENEYLEIWYDEGIIGLGIFLWFVFMVFFSSFNSIKNIYLSLINTQRKHLNPVQVERFQKQIILSGLTAGYFGLLTHNLMCVNGRFVSSGTFFWLIPGLILSITLSTSSNQVNKIIKNDKTKNTENNENSFNYFYNLLALGFGMVFVYYGYNFFLADLNHNKAIAYSKNSMWDKALEQYNIVIDYNPFYIMTHYFMGNVFNDRWDMNTVFNPKIDFDYKDKNKKFPPRNDAQRALWKYSDVKNMAPNYVQTHYQIGFVYSKLNMWEDAIENFSKAIDLDPVFPQNYFRIGWAYVKLGDWNNAEKTFNRAIEKKPEFIDSYINLGNVYFTQKKYKETEEIYLKALEIDPKAINVYRNLAMLYQTLGKMKDFEAFVKSRNMDINEIFKK